jgi:RNA polymerase sigma factor (sigma-70 family)
MDDRFLVARARAGDDSAFAALIKTHERSLYCTALALLRSSWDASDAVQEAFLEAYAKLETLREPAKFRPWLARILVNICYQTLNRGRRVFPVEEVPERAAHVFVGSEESLDLMAALRCLDEEHRWVVALRYFHDLKVDEIATIINCPAGTVKSRLNRALEKLNARLAETVQKEVAE